MCRDLAGRTWRGQGCSRDPSLQPCRYWIGRQYAAPAHRSWCTRLGNDVRDRLLPDCAGGEVRGDDLLEVLDDKRVSIRELGGTVCQPSLGDEVGEQAHQVNRPAFVVAKGRHFAWHGNGISHRKVLQRNPPACSEEWMMACHLDFTTAVCMHTESRLHAAINPVGNESRPPPALA